jgi:hypothetical protein
MIIRGSQQPTADVSPETEQASADLPNALQAMATEEFADDVAAGRMPSIRAILLKAPCGAVTRPTGPRVRCHARGWLGQSRGPTDCCPRDVAAILAGYQSAPSAAQVAGMAATRLQDREAPAMEGT